ncbi:MAG: hypothetical protein ACRC4N_01865, partial [Gammaproteobacteria bacterium]
MASVFITVGLGGVASVFIRFSLGGVASVFISVGLGGVASVFIRVVEQTCPNVDMFYSHALLCSP